MSNFNLTQPDAGHPPRVPLPVYREAVYYVPGDRERLDRVRASHAGLTRSDERFLLDAPLPAFAQHRSKTPSVNVNSVLSGTTTHQGRTAPVFFKPLYGVDQTNAAGYDQDSVVDVGLHEIVAWRLARELGAPWDAMVAPAVWFDQPGAASIMDCGPLLLGVGQDMSMPEPGAGFDQLVSNAAFFDALVGHQDRHDQNLRSDAAPPALFLIDHGYSFARPGDYHNTRQPHARPAGRRGQRPAGRPGGRLPAAAGHAARRPARRALAAYR